MKRNDYSNYSKGQEISGVTFQQHQNQVIESLNSVMLSLGLDPSEATVLFGLEGEGVGTGRSFSAGALFVNGEIFQVDAFTTDSASGEVYLTPKTIPVGSPVRFGDGILRAAHNDYKYEMSLSNASGSLALSALSRLQEILIQFTSDEANAYTNTKVGELISGAMNINTFAKVEDTLSALSFGSVTNLLEGVSVNQADATLHLLYNEPVRQIFGSDIPFEELVVAEEQPRVIRVFCDFAHRREGGDNDLWIAMLCYREGSGGAWRDLRGKKLFSDDSVRQASVRGRLVLEVSPSQDIQFGIKNIHDGGNEFPVFVSMSQDIEFDAIY